MGQSVIMFKDPEILGPDYCSKKPIFLPIHFPEMLAKMPNQNQMMQSGAPHQGQ